MLRKFAYNKIFRTSGMLFLFLLLLLFPASKEYKLEDETARKVSKTTYKTEVYLIDKNNYISRCFVDLYISNDIESSSKRLLELLIKEGKYESKIPNGFKVILPSDIKINSIKKDNDSIIVDLSNDLLELSDNDIKKVIELITYNLTTLKGINEVYIKIDNKLLNSYPESNNLIKQPFKRSDGVNIEYDTYSYKDVHKTTIYYVGKNSSSYYYIPVTKINNDNRDKIKIIVDELTSSRIYQTNLMSFLNYNTKLNNYEVKDDVLTVDFNNYLFDDIDNKSILEEVIYSISLSVRDNYNVNEVVFTVDGEQITKSVLKNIE